MKTYIRVTSTFESVLSSLSSLLFKASWLRSSLCALCVLLWQSALAGVHYVDMNSTNARPPYTNWATAAESISDAVVAAAAGDEILVTNGIYDPVVETRPFGISVRSVNGPELTFIFGNIFNRCAVLGPLTTLSGFTLSHGYSQYSEGGGVYGGTLNNCVLSGNSADCYGGGAAYSTLNNCVLTGNWTKGNCGPNYGAGGGAYRCTLNNCTLSGNSSRGSYDFGGGARESTLNNCTLNGNSAYRGGGAAYSALYYCTLTSNAADFGGGAYGNGYTLTRAAPSTGGRAKANSYQ